MTQGASRNLSSCTFEEMHLLSNNILCQGVKSKQPMSVFCNFNKYKFDNRIYDHLTETQLGPESSIYDRASFRKYFSKAFRERAPSPDTVLNTPFPNWTGNKEFSCFKKSLNVCPCSTNENNKSYISKQIFLHVRNHGMYLYFLVIQ